MRCFIEIGHGGVFNERSIVIFADIFRLYNEDISQNGKINGKSKAQKHIGK